MDGLDPGWFYSSLAQASAAIVGLVGAILGTRIIDHISTMRGERIQLNSIIDTTRSQIQGRVEQLTTFRNFLTREIEQDQEAIRENRTRRNISSGVSWGSSWSGSPREVQVDQGTVRRKELQIETIDKLLPLYAQLPNVISLMQIRECGRRLKTFAEGTPPSPDETDQPKSMILNDSRGLEGLAQVAEGFRGKLVPVSFVVVFLILAWIAFVGVVWPLSALPGLPTYPKGPMLYAFAFGIIGLVGYFAYQFIELWRLGRGLRP